MVSTELDSTKILWLPSFCLAAANAASHDAFFSMLGNWSVIFTRSSLYRTVNQSIISVCDYHLTTNQSSVSSVLYGCRVTAAIARVSTHNSFSVLQIKMDRRYQRLVKQNSGRVFTVGERQAAVENVSTWSDLRPSATRMEKSKHASTSVWSNSAASSGIFDFCFYFRIHVLC